MWEVACCMLIFIIILFIGAYLLFKSQEGKRPSKRCTSCGAYITSLDGNCQWCGEDQEVQSGHYSTTKQDKKTDRSVVKNPISTLFKKKNICPDCGRELIYRKEYHSWYCTDCHSYQ